jgi:hypothetical protein
MALTALLFSACASQSTRSAIPEPRGDAPVAVAWNDTAVAFRTLQRRVLAVRCPPAGIAFGITGTDVYTDDSSICTAALHAGRVSLANGGLVEIELRPSADGFAATLRNGVASRARTGTFSSFSFVAGPAPGLYASPLAPQPPQPPQPDPWTVNATSRRGQNGESYTIECTPNGRPRTTWGSDVYTDDSSICTAAVHAGRIRADEGGSVRYFVLPGRDLYFGSERHGVASNDYGAYPGSFAFDRTPQEPPFDVPEGARLVNSTFTAQTLRGTHDTVRLYCPPDVALRTVWGTGEYTDDSSVCTAAIHAGRIQRAQGGVVTIRPTAGRRSYRGTTANDVTTTEYREFGGSFVFDR